MADFFKSAFSYIGGSAVSQDNDFVGQYVELGNQKLRVKRVIAEGGFAFVFVAQESSSGKEYALKRLLASDEETCKNILQEICFLKKLVGHPNIVDFISAASIDKKDSDHGQAEFLILTELCTGGDLVQLLRSRGRPFPCDQVLHIFFQVCKAVQHMHKQKPAIIHRDLKVENLLLSARGQIKLCDFGSATTRAHYPDHTWSASKRSLVEDEITKNTTPMYRTPEMLDLYQNFPINEQQDIWALGCVLFLLCFNEHPYEDSAKLRIINANFTIPETDTQYAVFHDLIRGMFKVDPTERPTIHEVVSRLQEIAVARNVNLKSPLNILENSGSVISNQRASEPVASQAPVKRGGVSDYRDSPQNDPPVQQPPGNGASQNQSSVGGFFNAFRGGAASLVKNVKDASSKVMETVSATMNKSDLDISFITSRIAVMSFPGEGIETAYRNHIDEVRNYLESRYPKAYAVYNLSDRKYRVAKFDNRVSECCCPSKKAPPLSVLMSLCKNMHLWLRHSPKNICVLHCMDGKASSAMVTGALLCYCRLFDNASAAMHLFTARRMAPGITASQKRYIEYVCDMVSENSALPHNKAVTLGSVTMTPIPLFNRNKSGCRPFAEVYVGEERVLSTSQEYDKMRGFEGRDGRASIPLNCAVQGDVTVIVYHARSTFGGKVQGKITSIKICQFQFHTGFIQTDSRSLLLNKHNLDQLDTVDKYPEGFRINLDYVVSQKAGRAASTPWEGVSGKGLNPKLLFVDREEQHLIMSEFGVSERAKRKLGRSGSQSSTDQTSSESTPADSPAHQAASSTAPADGKAAAPSRPPPPAKNTGAHGQTAAPHAVGQSTFFDTLDWGDESRKNTAAPPGEEQKSDEFDWRGTSTGLMDDVSGEDSEDGSDDDYIGGNIKPPTQTKPPQFDDEFASFTADRSGPSGGSNKNQPDIVESNQAKETNVEDIMGGFTSLDTTDEQHQGPAITVNDENSHQEVVVDLLNMGSASQTESGKDAADLFDMGAPEPSNFDLLSGGGDLLAGTGPGVSSAPLSNASSNADLFGDFGGFPKQAENSGGKKQYSSNKNNNENTFDPFQQQSSSAAFDGLSFSTPQAQQASQAPSSNAGSSSNGKTGGDDVEFLSFMEDPSKQVPSPSDDLMGNWNATNMPKNNSFASIPRNSSTGSGLGSMNSGGMGGASTGSGSNPNIRQPAKVDPFANLTNLNFGLKSPTGTQQARPGNGTSPVGSTSSLGNNAASKGFGMAGATSPMGGGGVIGGSGTSQWQKSPQHQATTTTANVTQVFPSKPNYPSVIGDRTERGLKKTFGTRPKMANSQFDDLLGDFSAAKKEEGPKTIKEMRKDQLAQDTDPDKLKVMEWAEGKKKNIRALLCSLDQVLWEGESRWKGCGMHELVTAEQVKKQFRKAVLSVHPDKLHGEPHENLARNIFYELNDGWAVFEEEGMKSLYSQ